MARPQGDNCDDGDSDTIDDECNGSGVCEGIPEDISGDGGCALNSHPDFASAPGLGLMLLGMLGAAFLGSRARRN